MVLIFHFKCTLKCLQFVSIWTSLKFCRLGTQILDSSKLKEFADDNFKLGENSRKFFKWIENTVGKGEIASYKQFLLFPQYFQKACTADT